MAIPTQGNSVLVDAPDDKPPRLFAPPGSELCSWIMDRVTKWQDHRDAGYGKRWAEYWRLWRGQWSEEDKNRQSERSRLIAPALASAVEMTVSEIDEAIFSKDVWFDIPDDINDENKLDAVMARDMLLEDLESVNASDALSEVVLNGALFGTGIAKVNVYPATSYKLQRGDGQKLEAAEEERVYVCIESIRPDEFIPDPAGRTIQEMLGCAHRVKRPRHAVLEKIEQKIYREDALSMINGQYQSKDTTIDSSDPQALLTTEESEEVDIVEWHGKVPLRLMAALNRREDDPMPPASDEDDTSLIEAIVTIANGSTLLRATVNPFVMHDRSIVAFQFERVPGRFWGRGVCEKGYNPQKALDSELRARIDALGFISSPMLGVDSGRIPRGFKMEIKPGKVWTTQGPPDEILRPIILGDVNPNTFNQTGEMERMVQMGTGAFDTATALKNQSASGSNSLSANSMLMGAFVKRSKRSIANVDRNLLVPVLRKAMWRYMQFAPRRYPKDYNFRVKATLGIVAREVEAMQMTQLIGMLPEQYAPIALTLVESIIEHGSSPSKARIMQQINELSQPPPPEVQEKQKQLADLQYEAAKATAQGELLRNQKTIAEIRKLLAEAVATAKKGDVEDDKLVQEQQRIALMAAEIEQFEAQNRIAMQRLALQEEQLELKKKEAAKPKPSR